MTTELVSMKEAEAFIVSKIKDTMTEWFLKGHAEGRLAERQRIATLLCHPAAIGRETMALQLAYRTDLSVEAAVAQLEAAPRPLDQQAN